MLETSGRISVCANPDAPAWDDFAAGVSGHAWDPTLPLLNPSDFNDTLPDLSAVSPHALQGFDCTSSEVARHGLYPDFLYPSPTDMSGLLGPVDLAMAEVESQQPAVVPLQGSTDITEGNCQGKKVVLTIEEADQKTTETLLQVAFSSGSRFRFSRE